ncbi:MAG: DUF268 domain-containing protein [Lachnospiraceae bacterium]|nr:DUF268 domain-containing protein [Lachnospiraceae bacterium]
MKLLVWGTGGIAKQFIENGYAGEIIGFIETKKSKTEFMNKPVYQIEELPSPKQYDYIIVANKSVDAVYKVCHEKAIDLGKCIFLFPVRKECGNTDKEKIRAILGEKNYTKYCAALGEYRGTFFEQDLAAYKRLNKRETFAVEEQYLWPVISDKYADAGTIENYFWQDLWAAKLIAKSGQKEHFDIGSRVDGFIGHLLAMGIDVTMIDVRDFPKQIEGLHTIIDDATTLRQVSDESIESLSALCSLEHFGLGRYGDPIDPEACFKCFANIQKKLKKGGHLYISVPIGKERIEFNAHRIFYPATVINSFADMELLEFSCATEAEIEYNASIYKYDDDTHNGSYRFGLFHFRKKV